MEDEEARACRVAIVSVLVSTFCILAAVVALPILYAYTLQLQSFVQYEGEFCRSKTRDLWISALASPLRGNRKSRSVVETSTTPNGEKTPEGKVWHFGRLVPGPKPLVQQPQQTFPQFKQSNSRRAGRIIQPDTAIIYDTDYGLANGRAYDDYQGFFPFPPSFKTRIVET